MAVIQATDERQGGAQLQQQGERTRQRPPLTQPQPEDAGALHGPGRAGPARIQRKRNGQAGEYHAECQAGFHQQQGALACTCLEHPRQQQIEQSQAEGAECGGELDMPHQCDLQTEADQRWAEQCGGVDVIAATQRPAQQLVTCLRGISRIAQGATGEQQADGHVHQEEQHQERLGAPQQLRRVGTQAPGETNTEGADEADQVEQAPGLEPGDGEDAGVEQGEVGEQRDMVAAAGGGENRRGEAAQRGSRRQAQGILLHSENGREQRHRHQQAEGHARIEQRMQAHGSEHRQIEHGDAGALQHQGIAAVTPTQPPAKTEQGQGAGRNAHVAQLDRHLDAFSGVTQEEGQAEEQQNHADPQHGIAAKQPSLGRRDPPLDQVRLARRLLAPGALLWGRLRLVGDLGSQRFRVIDRLRRFGFRHGFERPVQFRHGFLGSDRLRRRLWRQVDNGFSRCRGRHWLRLAVFALLHLEQAFMHGAGAAFEAFGELLELRGQLRVARL